MANICPCQGQTSCHSVTFPSTWGLPHSLLMDILNNPKAPCRNLKTKSHHSSQYYQFLCVKWFSKKCFLGFIFLSYLLVLEIMQNNYYVSYFQNLAPIKWRGMTPHTHKCMYDNKWYEKSYALFIFILGVLLIVESLIENMIIGSCILHNY